MGWMKSIGRCNLTLILRCMNKEWGSEIENLAHLRLCFLYEGGRSSVCSMSKTVSRNANCHPAVTKADNEMAVSMRANNCCKVESSDCIFFIWHGIWGNSFLESGLMPESLPDFSCHVSHSLTLGCDGISTVSILSFTSGSHGWISDSMIYSSPPPTNLCARIVSILIDYRTWFSEAFTSVNQA